jgi:hypothetical protein
MKNGNEPAFAYGFANEQSHQEVTGLTKREYFAAMAMQGMLAKYGTDYQSQHAKESVYMADTLLKELEKSE